MYDSPVFSEYEKLTKFDHANHLPRVNGDCSVCHSFARLSANSADNILPQEENCRKCHSSEVRTSANEGWSNKCSRCHELGSLSLVGGSNAGGYWKPPIKFSHASHANAGISCKSCHTTGQDGSMTMPRMNTCTSCHATSGAKDQPNKGCFLCHVKDSRGVMYPRMMPNWPTLNHDEDWLMRHAQMSKLSPDTCNACHTKSDCLRCHGAMVKPQRIHPADWKLMHAAAARKDPARCNACHNFAHDCKSCHERLGITMSASNKASAQRVHIHPAGWASCSLNVNHHAYQARRSLATCAACHTESTCISCHKPGGRCGPMLSPHRHIDKSRLMRMKEKNPETCRKCHTNGIP